MSSKIKLDSSDFTAAKVWQDSTDLAVKVYQLTDDFPESEKYRLVSQLKRAVISVSTNIAEGYGRTSKKDKRHFYVIAYGSLLEVQSLLYLSNKLKLWENKDMIHDDIDSIKIQINAIRRSLND